MNGSTTPAQRSEDTNAAPVRMDERNASELPKALGEALAHATALALRELATVAQSAHHDADLRDSIAWVSDAVRAAATVDGAEPRTHPPAPAPLALDALRACLLSELRDAGAQVDAAGILRMLGAVERVHQIIEHDDAHRFSARLAGPGGLELLVEVGHDLRSPLASILFLAETLRSGQSGDVNTVQERQLGLIYSAAFGLSAVASDVIAFARGGDRLIDPKAEAFSVLAILRAVHDIVLPMAEEKGLAVLLSPPDADFRVGHPGALNRVLLNLTTNALKFTSSGHVDISVTAPSRSRLAFSGARHGARNSAAGDELTVRSLSQARSGRSRVLERGARALDLPQARLGDGRHARRRDERDERHALLLRARAAGGHAALSRATLR